MSLAQKNEKKYTYEDYLEWDDAERWELIDGDAYNMTPAPSFRHQRLAGNFYTILNIKLKGKPCTAGIAPIDVVLSKHDVVQPDVFVVCDKNKIGDVITGPPDLIVEVISPSSAIKDTRRKKNLYEKYGVREYILIHPTENYAERFFIGKKGKYNKAEIFGHNETLKLFSLEKMEICLSEVFELEKK